MAHQAEAATRAAGRNVVVATGTASGKSLAYQLPVLTALAEDPRAPRSTSRRPRRWRSTSCARSAALALTPVRAGDLRRRHPGEERDWVRRHAALDR